MAKRSSTFTTFGPISKSTPKITPSTRTSGEVTKFAPQKAPKSIASGKFTFDERVVARRVGVKITSDGETFLNLHTVRPFLKVATEDHSLDENIRSNPAFERWGFRVSGLGVGGWGWGWSSGLGVSGQGFRAEKFS